jgi:L-lactate utilization protein LutB
LTKEIGLTEALEAAGVQVIETDIGDRIIQLCGDILSHPIRKVKTGVGVVT